MSDSERRPGKSRLVYDKATRTIVKVPGHDEQIAALQTRLEAVERERDYAVASRDLWWDQLKTVQARLEVAERERDTAFARGAREGWMRCGVANIDIHFEGNPDNVADIDIRFPLELPDPLLAAQARIAELEMPVDDAELKSADDYLQSWAVIQHSAGLPDVAAKTLHISSLIRRLSRQSKSNALLGKCEEALRAIARQQYSTEMEDSEDGCFVDAYDDLIVIARTALSQIEQSKQLEVKETR